MNVDRKFSGAGVRDAIENLIFDAEEFGHNFIELRHLTPCSTQDVILGVEEARVISRRTVGSRVATAQGVKIIKDGVLTFYPDTRLRRWGYLLDTPKNRRWLASQLVSPLVEVVDSRIRNEIIELAEAEGFATERVQADVSLQNYLNKNVPDEVLEKNAEIEELKRQLAEEKKKAKEAKPLSGTRIKKETTTK